MKFILVFLVFICSYSLYSQENEFEVRISHHQRKLSLDYLPFPNTKFNPIDFKIRFPDSLYNRAHVEVKKFKVQMANERLFKNSYIVFVSEEKVIKQMGIAMNPKFVSRFENFLKNNYNLRKDQSSNELVIDVHGKRILIDKKRLKRQINYRFWISEN